MDLISLEPHFPLLPAVGELGLEIGLVLGRRDLVEIHDGLAPPGGIESRDALNLLPLVVVPLRLDVQEGPALLRLPGGEGGAAHPEPRRQA